MEKNYKVPIGMLEDIIKVFLFGIGIDHRDPVTNLKHDFIKHPYFDSIVEWKDLFTLRKHILEQMEKSKYPLIVKLAESMKDVYKDMEK